jgi:hypothetical protein
MIGAANEEMLSGFGPWYADLPLAAGVELAENSRLGFASRNPALHRGIAWSKSTLALGLPEWSGKTASDHVVAANNGSWSWNFTKSFFTGFSLKAVYRSFVDSNGCDRLMATTIAQDINPFPTDEIGPGDVAEIAPKAAGALGVINGLQVPALELSEGLEAVVAWAAPLFVGGHALYASGAAAYSGECH